MRMVLQIRRRRRHAILLEIGRSRADNASYRANLDGGKAEVWQVTDANGDVNALLDDVHRPVVEEGPPRHRRIGVKIFHHNRQHVHLAKQRGRRDRQCSGRRRVGAGSSRLRLDDVRQDAPAIIEVSASRVSQLYRARCTDEQACADHVLKGGDGARDGGRAHVQVARGLREAGSLRDLHEDAHSLPPIHKFSPPALGPRLFGREVRDGYTDRAPTCPENNRGATAGLSTCGRKLPIAAPRPRPRRPAPPQRVGTAQA